MNSMRFCFFSVRVFNRFLYFYGYIITYPIAFCNLCRSKTKRTLSKRRNFRAFCQILAWSTYSTSAFAFTKNHRKYRRLGFITYLHYFRILYISPIKQPATYLFATMHSQCFLASAKLLISQNPTFSSIVRSCISL